MRFVSSRSVLAAWQVPTLKIYTHTYKRKPFAKYLVHRKLIYSSFWYMCLLFACIPEGWLCDFPLQSQKQTRQFVSSLNTVWRYWCWFLPRNPHYVPITERFMKGYLPGMSWSGRQGLYQSMSLESLRWELSAAKQETIKLSHGGTTIPRTICSQFFWIYLGESLTETLRAGLYLLFLNSLQTEQACVPGQ